MLVAEKVAALLWNATASSENLIICSRLSWRPSLCSCILTRSILQSGRCSSHWRSWPPQPSWSLSASALMPNA